MKKQELRQKYKLLSDMEKAKLKELDNRYKREKKDINNKINYYENKVKEFD